MTIRLAIAFTILAGLVVVAAAGTLLERQNRRAKPKPRPRFAIGGPLYPGAAVVVAAEIAGGVVPLPVLDAHEVRVDELGEWEPTRHELLPAAIADRLLLERSWPNLMPPAWSAWTDAHPVVRLADLNELTAVPA